MLTGNAYDYEREKFIDCVKLKEKMEECYKTLHYLHVSSKRNKLQQELGYEDDSPGLNLENFP